jgi:membrane-associated phospholipid phosphatase
MGGSGRASARAAAVPVAGLVLTYGLATLTPLGRRLDLLATNGRFGAGWPVQAGDLLVLETVSVATFVLALAALVLVSGLRGRWELGLRGVLAVLGSILSAEVLKYLLPGQSRWTGQWSWIGGGTFPSGHAVIVTSIALAVLSISSDHWRRLLVGPLVAGPRSRPPRPSPSVGTIPAMSSAACSWRRPGTGR